MTDTYYLTAQGQVVYKVKPEGIYPAGVIPTRDISTGYIVEIIPSQTLTPQGLTDVNQAIILQQRYQQETLSKEGVKLAAEKIGQEQAQVVTPSTSEVRQDIYSKIYQQSKAEQYWTPEERAAVSKAAGTLQSTQQGLVFTYQQEQAQSTPQQVFQPRFIPSEPAQSTIPTGSIMSTKEALGEQSGLLIQASYAAEKGQQLSPEGSLSNIGYAAARGLIDLGIGTAYFGYGALTRPVETIVNLPSSTLSWLSGLGQSLRTEPAYAATQIGGMYAMGKLADIPAQRLTTIIKQGTTPIKFSEAESAQILLEPEGETAVGHAGFGIKIGKEEFAGLIKGNMIIGDSIKGFYDIRMGKLNANLELVKPTKTGVITETFVEQRGDTLLAQTAGKTMEAKPVLFEQRAKSTMILTEPSKEGTFALFSAKATETVETLAQYKGMNRYAGIGRMVVSGKGTPKVAGLGDQAFVGNVYQRIAPEPVKSLFREQRGTEPSIIRLPEEWSSGGLAWQQIQKINTVKEFGMSADIQAGLEAAKPSIARVIRQGIQYKAQPTVPPIFVQARNQRDLMPSTYPAPPWITRRPQDWTGMGTQGSQFDKFISGASPFQTSKVVVIPRSLMTTQELSKQNQGLRINTTNALGLGAIATSGTESGLGIASGLGLGQVQEQQQRQLQMTRQSTTPNTMTGIPTMPFMKQMSMFPPSFPILPQPRTTRERKDGGGKRPYRYTPTLIARTFGIFGRPLKTSIGEIRVIPLRSRRRRKRLIFK